MSKKVYVIILNWSLKANNHAVHVWFTHDALFQSVTAPVVFEADLMSLLFWNLKNTNEIWIPFNKHTSRREPGVCFPSFHECQLTGWGQGPGHRPMGQTCMVYIHIITSTSPIHVFGRGSWKTVREHKHRANATQQDPGIKARTTVSPVLPTCFMKPGFLEDVEFSSSWSLLYVANRWHQSRFVRDCSLPQDVYRHEVRLWTARNRIIYL